MGRSRKYIILNRIWEIFQTAVWVVQGGKLAGILPYFTLQRRRERKNYLQQLLMPLYLNRGTDI